MPFFWICPECARENYYSGSKTTNVVVQCKGCKTKVKASSHKKPEIKVKSEATHYQIQPQATNKLPTVKMNGMVQSLIIALNYAITPLRTKRK